MGNSDFNPTTSPSSSHEVQNQNPVFNSTPSITGIAIVGNQLSVNAVALDPENDAISYAYQWLVAGLDIPDANNQSLLLTTDHAHTNISVRVTADDGLNGHAVATSAVIAIENSIPVTTADNYTVNEDGILTNNDGVLINDTDADNDVLSVLNPGTFTATGIGGTITIATNGTFVYIPPADISGQSGFGFDVTDNFNVTSSSLSIAVLEVNDQPNFTVIGDITSSQPHTDNFAEDIVLGPPQENSQSVLQFNPDVTDSNSILNDISLNSDGSLDLDFSLNEGVAIIQATLQDDGGVANGGVDTSEVVEFTISYFDQVFENGFEEDGLKLFKYIDSINNASPLSHQIIYDFDSDTLKFYSHSLELNNNYDSKKTLLKVQYWLHEVLIKEDSLGDY